MTNDTPIKELPRITQEVFEEMGYYEDVFSDPSRWVESKRDPEFYAEYAEELIRAIGMRPRDIDTRSDVYELTNRPDELDGVISVLESVARYEGVETVEILRDLENQNEADSDE
jgi:hypothetical protein